ncbi:hypothetical protein LIER_18237 [Lithospermum erythrorhizon]|uniref:Uncharacterized protein n=1 Tax=Lithospermum erythrorhizon TaxID=34254 RepID=A0AAV3QE83_LITER
MEYIDHLPPMDLMRSEKMSFVQLIIPVESAHRAVSYLGLLGLLQFRDVGWVFLLKFGFFEDGGCWFAWSSSVS